MSAGASDDAPEDELLTVLRLIQKDMAEIKRSVAGVEARLEPIEAGMKIVNRIVDQHEPAFRELAHAAAQ
jgi:hypothetical protein